MVISYAGGECFKVSQGDLTIAFNPPAKGSTLASSKFGADIALVVTPPYVRPTPEGLVAHYRAVADQGGLPVVLYNVPGRTGCDMSPGVVAQLCSHDNIIGLKEARGDQERWQALYPLGGKDFALLSGDDPTFVRAMLGGAAGVISVASNVVPRAFARLCRLARAGEADQARALDARLAGLNDFLGVEPTPIPVKAILARQGIGHGLRLPLLPLSQAHAAAAIDQTPARLGGGPAEGAGGLGVGGIGAVGRAAEQADGRAVEGLDQNGGQGHGASTERMLARPMAKPAAVGVTESPGAWPPALYRRDAG